MSELELFDPKLVARKLGIEAERSTLDETGLAPGDWENSRTELYRSILRNPLGHRRQLLAGSEECLARLSRLAAAAPHFREVIGIVKRAVILSWRAKVGLKIPPILVTGDPGIGKSFTLRRIAEALHPPTTCRRGEAPVIAEHSFATSDDSATIGGHTLSWKNARPGLVASLLLSSPLANPVVLLDEIDKATADRDNKTDCLHALLEQDENASRFVDQFLEFPIRADYVIWLITANSVEGMRPSLLDRCIVIPVEQPSSEEKRLIAQQIVEAALVPYKRVVGRYEDSVVCRLDEFSPRQTKRLVGLAIALAASEGRSVLRTADIEAAARLVRPQAERRIGFHAGFHTTRP